MTQEALKLALEALEAGDWYINQLEMIVYSVDDDGTHENRAKVQKAITAIKKAFAQPEQELCGGCGGSGWVPRDPDIGTDQECFVCDGTGTQPKEPEQPAQQEPVAWANPNDLQNFDMKVRTNGGPLHTVPLYTTPPQRTEQEPVGWMVQAIEAAHGIKENT